MWNSYTDDYLKIIYNNLSIKNISNKKILDLWCWTWTFLSKFSSNNSTYWIDLSKNNIAIAKKKDTKSKYIIWDITDFNLDTKFDLITCCFDTINHLKNKKLWKKLFENVSKHIKSSWLFIFDINTIKKFTNINWKSIIKQIWKDYIIMETTSIKNKCNFKISIFSYLNWNYKLDVENITEISFETKEIINMLNNYFKSIEIINDNEDRIFFLCKK